MKQFTIALLLMLSSALYSFEAVASTDLLHKTVQAQQIDKQHNLQREAKFKQTQQALQQQLSQLTKTQQQLQQSIITLSQQFKDNEKALASQEKALTLASGSLGELFGVARQAAKAMNTSQSVPLTTIGHEDDVQLVQRILAGKTLPAKADLYGLWHAYQHQINASGEVQSFTVPFVAPTGEVSNKQVQRLGAFALVDQQGYVSWHASQSMASPVLQQPDNTPTMAMWQSTSSLPVATIDITRGQLLTQWANTPTLGQRVAQGGIVGKIILALLGLGLAIGGFRIVVLLTIKQKINRQLKQLDKPQTNNPLGRLILVHDKNATPHIETLELKLLETVMDEQQQLDLGISTIKLFAALAPMLGLLGTVTGMIDTFQTITQFGNADPKVMAGGISMALITTVLGLICAMPLLLIHNALSTLSESIRNSIEKQGVGLVAKRAEQQVESNR